ncbi:MAG: sigma-54-dependent Fis family transcriptional regulator [Deltaproteobacteria bacterium]|nr:sigma-54-dependent Fis family transcriptional regulator [Deltaproteobacteria bacterium]
MTKPTVLLVDDDHELRELLREQLEAKGHYSVVGVGNANEALGALSSQAIDVVVTDLRMPGNSGTQLCKEVVRLFPEVPVLLMTAFGSLDSAIEAIRAGAYDFLTKPFEPERLELSLHRALADRSLRDEVRELRRRTGKRPGHAGMVGTSPPMQRLYELIDRVGHSEASVLILGESGTGKELVARALHDRSRRSAGAFVALNCAAMPEALLESELFGHERGAFTDARTARRGLLREAEGGTVFLDEIGDLSPTLQPKLLRVLQERRLRPVGGDREVDVDVRVLAATHHDLRTDVDAGNFRADLYYRLGVITIDVPPLRDRGDDVLLLAEVFLDEIAVRERSAPPEIPNDVARRLLAYDWPGNVRELHNCMERCVALAQESGEIRVEHLPAELLEGVIDESPLPSEAPPGFLPLEEVERRHILRVVDAVDGNKSKAARILGIDRKTLHARLARYEE